MMNVLTFSRKKTIAAFLTAAVAVGSLSGCAVDNHAANAVATAAAVGGLAYVFYNVGDGLYYDKDYKPLPRSYRPSQRERVARVNDNRERRQQDPRFKRHEYQNHSRFQR